MYTMPHTLITNAVTRPPKTCIRTVHHAQTPKFAKTSTNLVPSLRKPIRTGIKAGIILHELNCTFRTQRSAAEPKRVDSDTHDLVQDIKRTFKHHFEVDSSEAGSEACR